MSGRNGNTVRVVAAAFCIMLIIYLIYTNQAIQTKFRDMENLAERYKRSQSALSTQLKDLLGVKSEQETRYQNDKDAMLGKYNALMQDFKLLKDSKEDLTTQYAQLTDECKKAKAEADSLQNQCAADYKLYKEKQYATVSNLRETVANLEREKVKYISDLADCKKSGDILQIERQKLIQNLESVNGEVNGLKSKLHEQIDKESVPKQSVSNEKAGISVRDQQVGDKQIDALNEHYRPNRAAANQQPGHNIDTANQQPGRNIDTAIQQPVRNIDTANQQLGHNNDAANQQPGHYNDAANQRVGHHNDAANQQAGQYNDAANRQVGHNKDAANQQPGHNIDTANRQVGHNNDAANQQPGHNIDTANQQHGPLKGVAGALGGEPGGDNRDEDFIQHQIKPPGGEEKHQGYRKDNVGANADEVEEGVKEQFNRDQQQNAQIQKPNMKGKEDETDIDDVIKFQPKKIQPLRPQIDQFDNAKNNDFVRENEKEDDVEGNGRLHKDM